MQTEDFDVQEIYNKALEQLSFLDYKNALKLFEQIKDEMDVNLYIAECKENLEKEENRKEYVRGSSAAKMYLQHNNLTDLRNAISIFEGLAKKDYKDSVEQHALLKKTYQKELVRINLMLKKRKKRLMTLVFGAIGAVIVSALTLIFVIIPMIRNIKYKDSYADLEFYVSATNGNEHSDKIKELILVLPDDYKDTLEYKNEYYYKRLRYLIINYDKYKDIEIKELFGLIPADYKEVASLKISYQERVNEYNYNKLLTLIGDYNGFASTNVEIAELITLIPSDYKEMSKITSDFEFVKRCSDTISRINDINYISTAASSALLRGAYLDLVLFDQQNDLWNCYTVYELIDVWKIVLGGKFVYEDYYFLLEDMGDNFYYLHWKMPTEVESGDDYIFDINYLNDNIFFSLINKVTQEKINIFSLRDISVIDNKLCVEVYINKLGQRLIFTYE